MSARQKFLLFLFLGAIFLSLPKNIQAARSMTIVSDKSSLMGDEEVVITASSSGFIDGETIYVKGAFYQDAPTSNYFGYTQKGDSWVKNSQTTTDQLSVKIGEWSNVLKVKSDFSDSGYKGEGDYKFKVGFYYTTSGGNLSSVQWSSNILAINLNEPDPTPTPTSTSTPEPTATPASEPTNTPAPTSTPKPPTSTPTLKPPTVTPTSKVTPTATASGEILGQEESSPGAFYPWVASGEAEAASSASPSSPSRLLPAILLGAGFILLFSAAFWLWYTRLRNEN